MARAVLIAGAVYLSLLCALPTHVKANSLGSGDEQHINYELLRKNISSLRGSLLLFDCDRQYPLINAHTYLKNASSTLENSLETSVEIASLYYSAAKKYYDQAVGYYRIVLEICTPK